MMVNLSLRIGTHSIKIRVDEDKKAAMLAVAKELAEKLEHTRTVNKVADGERAAVMVAFQYAAANAAASNTDLEQIEVAVDEALAVVSQAATK